jgi:glycosyltransferase involved in cell wall biosynthesis
MTIQMISLCITTYNRTDLLFESFAQVLDDPRISEIVIVDDHSDSNIFETVCKRIEDLSREYNTSKIFIYRNDANLDCYRNKRETVSKATNNWVIVWDSDNIMTKAYVDKLYGSKDPYGTWRESHIYHPYFAMPYFDFRKFSQLNISRHNIAHYMGDPAFETMLNAMNYFVNRGEYLRVWDGSVDPVTSDSLYQNYRWLEAGNSIYVVRGMEYEHRVHDGSHYKNNVKRTPHGFHQDIIQRLKNMR